MINIVYSNEIPKANTWGDAETEFIMVENTRNTI